MDNIKAVIFDIDGTLTTKNSWIYLTENLGGSVKEFLSIYKAGLTGEISHTEANIQLRDIWFRTGKATKNKFTQVFESIPLRAEATDLMEYLNAKKYLLTLITGSMDMFAEIIAKRLGVTSYYANTELIWNKTGELLETKYDYNQVSRKLKQLEIFCKENNLVPKECAVVGDSQNDLEIFRSTGNGILLETGLEDTAELKKVCWKKINNLKELEQIL